MTTFRTEDVYVDYRRPSSVSFERSLKKILSVDFTVNAFALNENAEIIDVHGLVDLDNRVLRLLVRLRNVNEDALRIIVGTTFCSELD